MRSADASVDRARWSALFTDATVVSSSSATSKAFQRKTSRRINTAVASAAGAGARRRRPGGPTPRFGELGGIGVGRHDPVVGEREDPRRLGERIRQRRVGRPRRHQFHRPRATFLAGQHVEAHVRRDAVEPRTQRRTCLRTTMRSPRARTSPGPRPRPRTRSRASVRVRGELGPVGLEVGNPRFDGNDRLGVQRSLRGGLALTLRPRRRRRPQPRAGPTDT